MRRSPDFVLRGELGRGFERFPCRFPSMVIVQPDTQPTPHTSSRSYSNNARWLRLEKLNTRRAAIRSGAAPPRIPARQRSKVCCGECLGRPWRGDAMKRTHLILKTETVAGLMVAVTAVGMVVVTAVAMLGGAEFTPSRLLKSADR
jgi:hypothetical protein